MSRDILLDIIEKFEPQKFINFFRQQNRKFITRNKALSKYSSDKFKKPLLLGEITFSDKYSSMVFCSFQSIEPLSERSGKKNQYDIGKKVLSDLQKDAGIFIFYDQNGNFRFSLIYPEYLGTKRKWSNFRRFTYFVCKDQTNKTFIKQIGDGDFSNLDSIKEAFSVEKVTKAFYRELADWYFWALKNIHYPKNAEKQKNGKNTELIRLVTRLIFIWFMKAKGLIPANLFDQQKLQNILKDFSSDKSTYYKAILQNLFFATLNTQINKRGFRAKHRYQGKNIDFMNHHIYRYEKYFKKRNKILSLFKDIPFLNGGLFECLDRIEKTDKDKKYIRIDGFSDRHDNQLSVPNHLFFSPEQKVNLNKEYGTKNKKYLVRGIIDILNSYNFTIDENTPVDEEVALDPELLGRVFENLLASYNPETATTARKATGSYYTPRTIVEYMVNQSLKQYFKNSFKNKQDIEIKLDQLLSYDNESNPFDKNDTVKLIELVHSVRVVDPAVGSGAFPMGILQKLVLVLSKLDPQNKIWKQQQIKAIKQNVEAPNLQKEFIDTINKNFREKELDYGRKLYLIQNCIYGVDIQQIAVQIAKLRFLISLLVDEKVNPKKENFGIEALPNLDYKIMQGNSLIELYSSQVVGQIAVEERDNLKERLKQLKSELFTEIDFKKKNKLRDQINSTLKELLTFDVKNKIFLIENKLREFKNQEKLFNLPGDNLDFSESSPRKFKKLEKEKKELEKILKNPPEDHFEWHLNFNEVFEEKEGFDIVIANPPYVRQEKIKNQKATLKNYEVYNSTSDLYTYFYEQSYNIIKNAGVLTFISSNKWMRARYGEKLRRFFREKAKIIQIIDFNGHKVFEATVDTNIIILRKEKPTENHIVPFVNVQSDFTGENIDRYLSKHQQSIGLEQLHDNGWSLVNEQILKIKEKVEKVGTLLEDWGVRIYRGIVTGLIEAFIIDEQKKSELIRKDIKNSNIIRPLLKGKDIKRYLPKFNGRYLILAQNGIDIKQEYPSIFEHLAQFKEKLEKRWDKGKHWSNLRDCDYYEEFERVKIIYPDISDRLTFAYDENKYYADNTAYILGTDNKYILAVLNSSLVNFYYGFVSSQLGSKAIRHFTIYIERIPIKKISEDEQKPFINLVDKTLAITKDDDYLENPAKQIKVHEYEKQIDQMVYKLYSLTPKEIKIVEGEK